MKEIRSAWVTVAPPSGHDLGSVVEAFWYVEGDTVVMCSESGTPLGQSERIGAGGNERAIASRLRRAAWSAESSGSDFSRPLNYPRGGVA